MGLLKLNNFTKKLICWGGGDQCMVIHPIVKDLGADFDIIFDDTPGLLSPIQNILLLQGKASFEKWLVGRDVSEIGFVIAIGNPYGFVRCQLHDYLVSKGLTAVSFCAQSALIDSDVQIGEGVQIMKGAIINSRVKIGRQCILNTRSLIEHHDQLADGVEIAPGAVLCGRVEVGKYSWIAANATILPRLKIGKNSIVGAGAVVTKNVPDQEIWTGVPARFLRKNEICGE